MAINTKVLVLHRPGAKTMDFTAKPVKHDDRHKAVYVTSGDMGGVLLLCYTYERSLPGKRRTSKFRDVGEDDKIMISRQA